MRHARHRRIVGAAVGALAAGLLATPASAAGTGLRATDPGADPKPRTVTGVQTDACDPTTEPGWVGRTVSGPLLHVNVASDTTGELSGRFGVWDVTNLDSTVFSGTATAYYPGTARINVPGLVDGHGYQWRAWGLQGQQISTPTPDCHFKVDLTSPTVAITSPDFPAQGSGQTPTKYAGQKGTFVLKGTDPAPAGGEASGVACFRYGWTSLGVADCTANDAVKPGADGTVTFDLKVLNWGTNNLNVQVIDTAGNVAAAGYQFYAPSNPNPPSTLGDVDGDGVADILLPDAQGNLQYLGANATDTTPNAKILANRSPSRASWAPYQVAHRGWDDSHAPSSDDLYIHKPGDGYLTIYRNFDYGAMAGSMTGSGSRECVADGWDTVPCPAGYADDWSKADQLVALGPVTDATSPSLLTLEGGDLWLQTGDFSYGYVNPRKLTTSGAWSGYDLVAPGPDAAGNLALWARERATGALHAYPVPKQADGTFDFSALADPAAGVVATGFTVDAYPALGSSGDGDGDGQPDLWAVTADRHLVTYSGWSTPKDLGALR